jgi:hypothetical protein
MGSEAMMSRITRWLAPAILLSAFAATAAQPAFAQAPDLILPIGQGCPDFNLGLTSTGGNLHTKTLTDRNGNPVRIITAGKGVDLTYTNYGSDPKAPVAGKSVTIKTAGSVSNTVINPDGTSTVTLTGHNGLILFPTDFPAGPSTTQYTGRVVFTVDKNSVFTLISAAGPARNICAALS